MTKKVRDQALHDVIFSLNTWLGMLRDGTVTASTTSGPLTSVLASDLHDAILTLVVVKDA